MNLTIHTGNHALTQFASDGFMSRWLSLHDACSWATGFQHPDFVMPWYELYQDRFLPVLVVGEADDGSLAGLFTLALHAAEKKLVGAGERQAEYHAWLERENAGNGFFQAALIKLRNHFPGIDLCLKYLPANAPLDWIGTKASRRGVISLRPYRRPIMCVDADGMDRQRRKKNHRQNYNRLKKTGDVTFERIVDHDRFARLLEVLCMQYDFRQGALHHYMPFASDPAKKLFYLELHRRGLLHTSILSVGDQIAASHSGLISKGNAVHLGINTHAPALAAHSPGNLLLAMLGVHLVEENMAALDLTPGGDGYKEHFATEHDVVHELIVYGSILRRWKKEVLWNAKQVLKARMQKAGWRTADAWAVIGKIKKLKSLGLRDLLGGLPAQWKVPEQMFRYCPERSSVAKVSLGISRNSLQDLRLYEPGHRSLARWDFFRTSMERMERCIDVYSHARGGKLLACCWVRREEVAASQQNGDQEESLPSQTIVLFDPYIHPDIKDARVIQQFITQILSEIKDGLGDPSIYFKGVFSNELREALLQCGFVDEAGLNGSSPEASSALGRSMQDISTGA